MKKYYSVCLVLPLCALFLMGCPPDPAPNQNHGNVVYVDVAQTSTPEDGTTWGTAYNTIQEGIDAAEALMNAGTICEVWVKKGVYSEYITLCDNVELYGNFNGTEDEGSDWHAPNFEYFEPSNYTVLQPNPNVTEYHIVTGAGGALLCGCVVRNGNASYSNDITDGRNTGGGVFVAGETQAMNIGYCYFLDNHAARFGGAIRSNGVKVNIGYSRFEGNTVSNNFTMPDQMANGGGAVYSFSSGSTRLLQIYDCTFRNNSVASGTEGGAWGGAVASYGSTLIVHSCSFRFNQATGPYSMGGAVFTDMATLNSEKCNYDSENNDYYGNSSEYKGGAMYVKESGRLITSDDFEGNCAVYGGALCIESDNTTVTDCSFAGNSVGATEASHAYGGAVFTNEISAAIKRCRFEKNWCSDRLGKVGFGGGLFMQYGEVTVENCYFTQNHAYAGGGLYAWMAKSAEFDILNCTITYNQSKGTGTLGGGIRCAGDYTGKLTFTNTILYRNFQADGASNDILAGSALDVSASYSVVPSSVWPRPNCFHTNPRFVDAPTSFNDEDFDLDLAANSPCIDAANPANNVAPEVDIEGTARPYGSAADIGAYEYDPN